MAQMARFVLGLFIMISLFSCTQKSTFKVGYMNASTDRTRFVREGNFMAEKLREMGHEVIIVAAEDNDAKQIAQGYELLEQGVDALVIVSVNGNTIAPLVRDARRMGVKVIGYNRLINNADFDFFVTGDNKDYARLFCESALTERPTGNYVVLGGDRFDRNGLELKHHIDNFLKPHIESGNINLLYGTFIEGWNKERAMFEMRQVIEAYGTNIDVVIACNDPMGMGALEILKQYDAHHDVLITGQGAYIDVVRSIFQGEMFMTLSHPSKELGYKTAELIVEILKGERPSNLATSYIFNGASDIATVNFPSIKVTKENLEEALITSGEFSWSDIR
jgi:D-xylose transport system substrate-binding protein